VLLGDVGRAVLHDSPCAVAVAPDRFREHVAVPQTVVVGYDGSAESREALRHGEAIAAARHASLRVCVVCAAPPAIAAATAYPGEAEAIAAEDHERAVRVLADALAALPPETQGEVRHGKPATQLAESAGAADLIVVGSRGWGALRRVVLGSTADRLAHDAPCPVLIVPRPVAAGPDRPAAEAVTAGQEACA
jgi:nucleotide-binding universal stress UspA family protein